MDCRRREAEKEGVGLHEEGVVRDRGWRMAAEVETCGVLVHHEHVLVKQAQEGFPIGFGANVEPPLQEVLITSLQKK